MSYQRWECYMISASCDIEAFIKAVEHKNEFEIISLANQEATAAWRQKKSGKACDPLVDQYEHALEELIWCLRQPVTYRPFNLSSKISEKFYQLRQKGRMGKRQDAPSPH